MKLVFQKKMLVTLIEQQVGWLNMEKWVGVFERQRGRERQRETIHCANVSFTNILFLFLFQKLVLPTPAPHVWCMQLV